MNAETKIKQKYLARLLLEAETPLHVGSGNSDLTLDAPINCDANGLPQVNGTSLAGVLKSAFMDLKGIKDEKEINESNAVGRFFGFKGENNDESEKGGKGSRLVVSNAHLVYGKDKVVEGLMMPDEIQKNEYLSAMSTYALPLRDHCRIGDKGSAADKGKFDNCVLPKGVRFICELELTEYHDDTLKADWEELLKIFASPMFRIGGKVRSGLGKLKVNKCWSREFDFSKENDLGAYLKHNSSFNKNIEWEECCLQAGNMDQYDCYTLKIQPENFFTFGSGYGDEDVDMVPKKEIVVKWDNGEPDMSEVNILIPASSIKGAISHRVAYHYNKLMKQYVGAGKVGTDNEAVKTLFGYDKKAEDKNKAEKETAAEDSKIDPTAGRVFLDDMLIEEKVCEKTNEKINGEKIFNHVSIDRFTGGAISGALFNEKVCGNGYKFKPIDIYVEKSAFDREHDPDGNIETAFKRTLDDICNGMLPLGGSTMRGHGCFTGIWRKEGGEND